jgi:chloride channel protein, CIC family
VANPPRLLRFRALIRPWVGLRRRFRTDERGYAVAMVLAAGFIGAVAAVGVRYAGLGIQGLAFWNLDEPLDLSRSLRFPWIVLAPALGGLAAGLAIRAMLPKGPGAEGTSEIMEAVSLKGAGRLQLGQTLRKSFASILLNATGGSVGREGPIVQIAAATVSKLTLALRVPVERRRVLIGCGVAAGMAASYNSPIGAAMFVMEVIHGNFALEIFGPVVLASVTATMLSWGAFGSAPLFPVPPGDAPSLLSLPLFALLGAVVAGCGLLLRGGIENSERLFRRVKLPLYLRTALGGLVVGLLAWAIPEVWGNGYDAVQGVLRGDVLLLLLLPLMVAKIAATGASIGSGGSGGVFTPTLLVGAAGGTLFGAGAQLAFPGLGVDPIYFALGGMTAAVASTTFAPITALIIVFEMCQNYGSLMPLAVVTVSATVVARRLRRDSIYTAALRRRGVDFDLAFEQMALGTLRAEDLIRTNPLTLRSGAPLAEVLQRFTESRQTALYVLDAEDRLVGAIDLRDAFQVAGRPELGRSLVALDLVRDVPRITPRTSLEEVMGRFSQLELAQLPVVRPQDPDRLIGTVSRRDVVSALDREVLRRRMVLATYLGGRSGVEAGARRAGDLTIRETPPPPFMIGRTLEEIDPHQTLGLYVLALRRVESGVRRDLSPAPPDLALREGDVLVWLGPAGAFASLDPPDPGAGAPRGPVV